MGEKKQLTISPCTVKENGDILVKSDKSFVVMLNPAKYSHNFSINYNSKKVMGQPAQEIKFNAINAEKISFDIVLDGTGVVKLPGNKKKWDVKTQVNKLKKIVYNYDGQEHEPDPVRLFWGSLIFFCRLESMSLEYTLFTPGGKPLRANLKLAFIGYTSKEENALRANKSSPDLTHRIEVKAGDTLPLLCYRIYKDCLYYLEVAKINNIVNIRHIKPGDRLYFPPLR